MRTFRRRNSASLLLAILLCGLIPSRVMPQGADKGEILVRVFLPNGEIANIPAELVESTKYSEGPLFLKPLFQKPEGDTAAGYRFTVAAGDYYARAGNSEGNFVRTYFPNTPNPEEAKPIHVSPGEHVTADIHLSSAPKFKITGRIVDLLPDREPHHFSGVSLMSASPTVREYKHVNPFAGIPFCCAVEQVPDVDVSLSVSNDRFEISGVRAGEYELIGRIVVGDVIPDGLIELKKGKPRPYSRSYTGRISVKVTKGDIDDANIEVTHGIDLQGQFVSTGKRLNFEETDLFYWNTEALPGTFDFAVARKDGRFAIPNLEAGTYQIRIGGLPENAYVEDVFHGERRIPGGKGITMFAPFRIPLKKGSTESLRFIVNPNGGIISGKVNGGILATLVLFPAEDSSTNAFRSSRRSNASGDFKIPGIPPGSYRLYAFRHTSKLADANPLEFAEAIVRQGTPLTVTPGGRVEVRLNLID